MRTVEKAGRTVDEAVALALAELGVGRDRVEVEVVAAPRPGLFGLLARPAVVRVRLRETARERVEAFLEAVCSAMGVTMAVAAREEGETLFVELTGAEAGRVIGHHGQTLEALQLLAGLVAGRVEPGKRVVLDVAGYRRRREEALARLARRVAERVRRTGQRVVLDPMPAQERRVIHLALAGHPHVRTASEGDEPNRRVVVEPRRQG